MDVRYLAWAGYVLDETAISVNTGPPEFISDFVGERRMKGSVTTKKVNIKGSDVKPTLVAYPRPTV